MLKIRVLTKIDVFAGFAGFAEICRVCRAMSHTGSYPCHMLYNTEKGVLYPGSYTNRPGTTLSRQNILFVVITAFIF